MCVPETEQHSSVFGVGPMSNTRAQILLCRNILLPLFSLHSSSSMSCLLQTCGLVRACDETSAEHCGDTPNDGLITERQRLCAGQRPLSLLLTAFSCIFFPHKQAGADRRSPFTRFIQPSLQPCLVKLFSSVSAVFPHHLFFIIFFIIFHNCLMVSASSFSNI